MTVELKHNNLRCHPRRNPITSDVDDLSPQAKRSPASSKTASTQPSLNATNLTWLLSQVGSLETTNDSTELSFESALGFRNR